MDREMFCLRIPTDLLDKIRSVAEEEDRSVNNMMLQILKDWLTTQGYMKSEVC